ncbi:hypothetical protein [Miltoncostaea marina]|uniref:hypothetical protein n=1 Tax=Miltoncostaea marina TaxID=2843215 RepID=UPI001C3C4488|nr:hypothetical protein [Miltoncostaea marina]
MRSPDGERAIDRTARGLAHGLASRATRRSFLAAVAAGALALVGAAPAEGARRRRVYGTRRTKQGWYGFCGHTWTTGSCPAPGPLPRVDPRGYPVRPTDGRPIDDRGRLVDALGRPVDEAGAPLVRRDGTPLPKAPRTRLCEDWVPKRFGITTVTQGAWYRCCDNQIRKLADCCSTSRVRINGDASLRGYCRPGRRVFCVMYVDTGVPC